MRFGSHRSLKSALGGGKSAPSIMTPAQGEKWVISLVNDVMQSSYWNTMLRSSSYRTRAAGFYYHVFSPAWFSYHNFTSPLLGLDSVATTFNGMPLQCGHRHFLSPV